MCSGSRALTAAASYRTWWVETSPCIGCGPVVDTVTIDAGDAKPVLTGTGPTVLVPGQIVERDTT